jgi:hypothetical protein
MTFDDHQMINDIHAELLQYLEDKNLRQIFVSIVEAILLHKPDNPVEYIVNFLKVLFSLSLPQVILPNETKVSR